MSEIGIEQARIKRWPRNSCHQLLHDATPSAHNYGFMNYDWLTREEKVQTEIMNGPI